MDWQRFESGEMSEEEMKEAQAMLDSDSLSREELAGLKKFRAAIRSASLGEPVPQERLERIFEAASQRTPPRPRPVRWAWAAVPVAVCILVGLFFLRPGPQVFDPNGQKAILALEDSPVSFPLVDLEGKGRFVSLEVVGPEVRYTFETEGVRMSLSRSRPVQHPASAPVVQLAGRQMVEDDGLCWYCPSSSYKLTGGTAAMRKKWAEILVQQTGARRLRPGDFAS